MGDEDDDSRAGFEDRGIDDVIHGRVRLAVMAFLSGAGAADFALLRRKVGVTDGNLSAHTQKLEEAGYMVVEKRFSGRRPLTLCHLTKKGWEASIAYIARMQALLRPNAAR